MAEETSRSLVADQETPDAGQQLQDSEETQTASDQPTTTGDPVVDGAAATVTRHLERRNLGKDFDAKLSKGLRERGEVAVFARNTDERITELLNRGYRIAKPAEVESHTGVERNKRIVQGDTVLMIAPEEIVQARVQAKQNDRRRMEGDYSQHDAAAGIEAREAHGQRRGNRRYFIP